MRACVCFALTNLLPCCFDKGPLALLASNLPASVFKVFIRTLMLAVGSAWNLEGHIQTAEIPNLIPTVEEAIFSYRKHILNWICTLGSQGWLLGKEREWTWTYRSSNSHDGPGWKQEGDSSQAGEFKGGCFVLKSKGEKKRKNSSLQRPGPTPCRPLEAEA